MIEKIMARLGYFKKRKYESLTEEAVMEIIDLYDRLPKHLSYNGFVHPKSRSEHDAVTKVAKTGRLIKSRDTYNRGEMFPMMFFKEV